MSDLFLIAAIALGALVAALATHGALWDNGVTRRLREVPVTLSLRRFDAPPSAQLEPGANVFAVEFNHFFLALTHILDYAVMRYVGQNVKILKQQESRHAKMHLAEIEACESRGLSFRRLRPLLWLFERLLLKSGRTLGLTLSLAIETAASVGFYVLLRLPFCRQFSDIVLLHMWEEIEHGVVTVHCLRPQSRLFARALCFPLGVALFAVYFLSPPLTCALSSPRVLLRWRTYPDAARYYAAFIPAFLASAAFLCAHFLPPSRSGAAGETSGMHASFLATATALASQRGSLAHTVERSETFLVPC